MRRVGLLTYHRSVNDGSIIQAYCLCSLLQCQLPGTQVEIVDYMPAALHRRHQRLALYNYRPPFFNPRYVWSYSNQTAFLRRHCRLSKERLVSDNLDAAHRFIAAQGYDAVVVGSDNSWEVEGHLAPPNAYFRPTPGVPTFAFAPSADPAPDVDSPWRGGAKARELRCGLEAFRVITVRDEGTREFIHALGIAPGRVGHLPDPTLLWDFSEHLARPAQLGSGRKPLAALASVNLEIARPMRRHILDAGFELFSLMGARQLKGGIAPPRFSTIQQRLGMYPFFDATITDRFHMSIFALKHGRGPVVFLEDATRWPRANSKGRDLFTRLGLEEMVWRLDQRSVSADKLRELLAAWRRVSQGLPLRLGALRAAAEKTGYSGIMPALKDVLAKRAAWQGR
jgi:hypothetical protein